MRHLINLFEAVPPEGRRKRTTEPEFIQMARTQLGAKSANLTLTDLMDLATKNNVQVPTSLKFNKDLKTDPHHWNLYGSAEDVDQTVAKDLGIDVEKIQPDEELPKDYADTMRLAKAQEIKRLAAKGFVYLFGRRTETTASGKKGAFFRIPGLEEYSAQLERMLSRQLEAQGDNSMEEQYSLLKDKVELIAGGKSQFIKSLLLCGAPSSGKTFTVMQTIKSMGLKEGTDYIVKKGYTTPPQMYRLLIEQLNGMLIFDDCDSVRETTRGINMLKGALDTEAVREVSDEVRGNINTAALPEDIRNEYTERLSRALRYLQTPDDIEYFHGFLRKVGLLNKALKGLKRKPAGDRDEDGEEDIDDIDDEGGLDVDLTQEQELILHFVRTHMPNKIDFRGRIIFISNLDESEWDTAILTRAFFQNMNFKDREMLDFINKIKGNIPAAITEEQKQEVWDFVTDLWTSGKLQKPVNFRLAQAAFDMRLTPNWRKMLSS